MEKELKDIEFMMSVSKDTRDSILKFYEQLENLQNISEWIKSFTDAQKLLSREFNLEKLKDSDNAPHKTCFKLFQNYMMDENNAEELREKFLQLKKEFKTLP